MSALPRPTAAAGPKIRVLIVDDSIVLRSLLSKVLAEEPLLEIVGVARNGRDALDKVPRLQPDVVTLDIEMPELDGLATLRLLQQQHPKVKVIMCSSLTERGASATVEALIAGASDYVTKRSEAENALEAVGRDLRGKILNLFARAARAPVDTLRIVPRHAAIARRTKPRILAIGVSTGGPAALARIIPRLPAEFPLPVVIVQHMPPVFTATLAARLAETSAVPVWEAAHGMKVVPGSVYLAPGDFHMQVAELYGEHVLQLNQAERENSCRPAVDVLFRSVARVYGAASLAMILTGMGRDGCSGARELKARGARILAQDAASSVVWGMPGAVVEAALADKVLPLDDMLAEVLGSL